MERELKEKFIDIFAGDKDGINIYFAPGRVNLIGEHIDYNGGNVFPCALSIGTYAAVRKRDDSFMNLYSLNFENAGKIIFDLNDLKKDNAHDWANYPKGVIKVLKDAGYIIDKGFDILYYGNIPNGSGLSSSASIEVLTGKIFQKEAGLNISMKEIALFSQKAENSFIGVNCGIMDQFSIAMGKNDHAILLNCETLEYKYVPLVLENISIVIGNTNKKRGLADSKYNERRSSCEAAVKDLKDNGIDIDYLCQLSDTRFEEIKYIIKSEENLKRARHAVYENQRVYSAVKELEKGNIDEFGRLMNQSHISLRDDYEVTGKELDAMVEAAWKVPGVIGARMTGAGFGGCTVALVRDESVKRYIEEVGREYKEKTGLIPEFYTVKVGDGAKKI